MRKILGNMSFGRDTDIATEPLVVADIESPTPLAFTRVLAEVTDFESIDVEDRFIFILSIKRWVSDKIMFDTFESESSSNLNFVGFRTGLAERIVTISKTVLTIRFIWSRVISQTNKRRKEIGALVRLSDSAIGEVSKSASKAERKMVGKSIFVLESESDMDSSRGADSDIVGIGIFVVILPTESESEINIVSKSVTWYFAPTGKHAPIEAEERNRLPDFGRVVETSSRDSDTESREPMPTLPETIITCLPADTESKGGETVNRLLLSIFTFEELVGLKDLAMFDL